VYGSGEIVMLNRRLSMRSRLLASVMISFIPAAAMGANVVTNSGTMDGGAGPAIDFRTDTVPAIITNSGTIRGGAGVAILTGSGDDILNLSTGSTIIGLVDLGGGFDTINLDGSGAAQTSTQRLLKTLGGERLNVNSGYWQMRGEVNADLVNIASGATLGIDDVGAQSVGGAFITPNGPTLTVINNGSLVLNTADTRTDAFADNLHLSGTGAVYLGGGGTMQYGKNVTLTGVTNLNGGTLVVTGDNIASHINVNATSTLRIGAAYSAPDADGYVTIVPGGGTSGSIASDISNANLVVFDRADESTYAGVINGTGRVVKEGGGNLILTGGIASTGGLTINGGVVTFGNGGTTGGADGDIVTNATLAFDRSDAVTYGRVISGSGGVTQTGAGMLTLTADNTYTGVTRIEAGSTLKLGEAGSVGSVAGDIVNNGALIVDHNAQFTLYYGAISGTGTLNKRGSGLDVLLGDNTYTGLTTVESGVLQIGSGTGPGSITSDVSLLAGHLTFVRTDTSTYGGNVSGAGQVTKFGTGTLILTGSLTQSGLTLIDSGTLQIGAGGTTGSVSGSILNNASLAFNRSDDTTFTGSVTGSGSVMKLGTNTLTVTGGLNSGGGTTIAGGTLRIGNGGNTGSLSGNVINNGALVFDRSANSSYTGSVSGTGSFTKAGAGELQLFGALTHTGGTNVTGGALRVRGSITGLTTLSSGATLIVNAGGSTRFVNGDGATVSNFGTIQTPLVTTGQAATIALGDAGNTINNAGVIRSYNGNAIRLGAGADTLNLSTGSVITGRVDMGGGVDTVNLTGASATKTTTQSFGNVFGSELLNVNSGYWTLNGEVEANTVTIASGATFEVDDVAAAANGGAFITPPGGVLNVANSGALIVNTADTRLDLNADSLHLGGSGTVELTGGGAIQYGQNVSLTGRTTVTNGTLVVTGDNIAGPVSVGAQGILRIGAAYSAPDADGYVTIVSGGGQSGSITGDIAITTSGQVIFDRATDSTYSGAISGNGFGRIAKRGAGVLTLAGSSVTPFLVEQGGLNVTGALSPLGVSVVNDGASLTIASTGTAGRLGGNGATITNAGTIDFTSAGFGGAMIELGRASTVNNSGVIHAANGLAIRFGAGADTLNLSTGSSITGRVEMGGGTDTINLAGTSNTSTTTQAFGKIFGSEVLNVNSGYWTMTGETAADQVNIAAGATLDLYSIGAAPGEGGFITPGSGVLTIANNGAAIVSTDDTRLDNGADSLHLGGSGTLELRGGGAIQYGQNVTLTGATTVTNGALVVTGDNLVTPITVGAQGTLRVGAAFSAPDVDGYVTIVSGGGTTGSLSGNVANNGAVIFDRANASTYGGTMSGTGTVTKSGAGVLTLSGANTYTGVTTVTGGGLVVSAPFASNVSLAGGTNLTFTGPNAMAYGGVVSGAGALVKTGSGVLTLSGANTHTGGTNVQAGGLRVTGSVLGATTLASGTTLEVAAAGSTRGVNGNGVTVVNAGTIETPLLTTGTVATVSLGDASNTLTNSGTIRSYNNNAIRFGAGADTLNLATGSSIVGRVDMGGGADVINLAGTSATKAGTQTLGEIFGSETLNVNAGYWTLNKEVEADLVTVAGGATLELDSVGAAPGQGGFISGNAVVKTVANNGAIIQNTSDARLDDGADNLHIGGSGTVELKGGGALQYGANTTLTGATTITNGLLVVTGDNIASSLNVGAQGVVRIGAAFSAPDADGFVTLASGGGTTGSLAGNVANNGVVIFDRANASTYGGTMSGTGTVTKSGAGVLTLSGANTYTGATTVTAGGLVVSAPFASSGVSLAGGTGLTFTGPNALTYAGVVSGAGGLTKTGAGVTTLSGVNTYTGATTVSAGGLSVTGSIASQSVSVAGGANLTFGSAVNQTYAGVVSGAGSLTKSGAGALTLTGANTYTGATTVSGGSLILATTLGSNVTVNQGGTLQIGTGGTTGHLTGSLRADGTVIFNRSDNYVYAGAFSGSGSLIKRGAGLLTLDGVYTFSGTTTIEAGTIKITQLDAGGSLVVGSGSTVDLSGGSQTVGGLAGGTGSTVNIENATLTVNQPTSTTPTVFNGALTGSGSLVVTGSGVLDLAGANTYTGPTTVNGGTLKVNGSVTSNVTVNNGGTLGGSGTIGGAVTIGSGGSISPGNSPGVTNIAGPLTLAAGSNMIVEVDPTATIKNDRINVTAGAATIVAGAKLDVRPLGAIANYDRVSDYTILTATGGVNGTFGSNVTSSMALLTPIVSYSTNEVRLRLIRNDISFASLAATENQAAVAAAAEGTGTSGAAFGALIGQDQAGARAGYDALSGEVYGAAGSLMIDDGRHQRAALLRHAGSSDAGAWASLHNGEATIDAGSGAAEAKNRSFGVTGGGQTSAGGWNLGFALGYGTSDVTADARSSVIEAETLRAGVYGGSSFGAWRVRLGADLAQHDFEAKRGIAFPTVTEAVAAEYDGSSRQLFGELAYATDFVGGSLEPFVEVAGVWAKTDAFTETGGTLGLSVAEQDRNVTFATVGARFSGAYDTGGAVIRPQLSLAWRRAGGDIEGTSTAAFGTSSFTVTGASLAKDTALIDAGVGFDITSAVTGSLSYSGAVSSDAKDHAVRAGLFVRF
jgi:autotransporter-associated beta strand protein